MKKTAQQIFEECGQNCALVGLQGKPSIEIQGIAAYGNSKKGDLIFVPDRNALNKALLMEFSGIVIPKGLADAAENAGKDIAIFISAHVPLSHALMKQRYGEHDYSRSGWGRIHPSAIVHDSVKIPEDTILGPNVIIEQGVQVGSGCHIMANVVIEHDAVIGNKTRIHPGTIIGWECVIGDHCLILSNSVIGGEGFGYSQDQHFNHHRIPQTGNVVIGNRVTIGACNTIDRGTYGSTIIGNGCIFDNICHVAHNVTMGENCIIITGFLGGGSSTIGNRVVASACTMIKDHVNICDNTYLVHRAGVNKDITEPGMYAGGPTLPMKEYVKNNAIYQRLGELRQQVLALSKGNENGKVEP